MDYLVTGKMTCNYCGVPTSGIVTICTECAAANPPEYEISYYFADGRELIHSFASYGDHRYYGEKRRENARR
jgi:hypothetical protein